MRKHQLADDLQTSEVAAGVDASTTAHDLHRDAGVLGWQAYLGATAPRQVVAATSGGGSVNFTVDGAVVNPGTTSGDTAYLQSMELVGTGAFDLVRTTYVIRPMTATPMTDEIEVGQVQSGPNSGGAYLDFTTGEYAVGAGTARSAKAASLPTNGAVSVLTIEADFKAGETRFSQRGAVNEDATISTTDPGWNDLLVATSNGAGDELRARFCRAALYAEVSR